mmetsp:Transcript_77893/g.226046  ORF Transcript_77893/g.226046 Transcript_77893/m.226046 type:complete len:211 (-) Transcript_77893:208-840(-)
MVFHIADISLAKEWLGTCGEYFQNIKKPFGKMGFKAMFRCNEDNLDDWFTTWSVVQFWWAVIVSVVCAILFLAFVGFDISAIQNLLVSILGAYMWAHMGWFAVTKKQGCCCFCCCFCISQAPILLLIFGIWLIIWSVLLVVQSLAMISLFALGFVYTILYVTYAVPLTYMGIIMVKKWQTLKGDPPFGKTSRVVVGNPTSASEVSEVNLS